MTKRKPPALELPPAPDGLTFATFGPWQETIYRHPEPDTEDVWHVAVVAGPFRYIGMSDDEAARHIAARLGSPPCPAGACTAGARPSSPTSYTRTNS